jgi:deferrochelatase/peroxidase EfeB
MKLDQKQMHLVSQLFMVSSKAGHGFDLSRFTKDQEYARETLIQLAMHADRASNEAWQALVTSAMSQIGAIKEAAPATALQPAPQPATTEPIKAATPSLTVEQQYVGRLR